MLYQLRFSAIDKSSEEARTVRRTALVYAESLTESIASLTSALNSKPELLLELNSVDSSSKSRVSKVFFDPTDDGEFYRCRLLVHEDGEKNSQDFIVVQTKSISEATSKAEEIYEKQGISAAVTTAVKLDFLLVPELVQDAGEVLS